MLNNHRKNILIIYVPVIHKGFLDFLKKVKKNISKIYLINKSLEKELSEVNPDIASIGVKTIKNLLEKLDFQQVSILSKKNLKQVKGSKIILIQNEISRNLEKKYLKGEKIEWESVFLRWEKNLILTEIPINKINKSKNFFDLKMMNEAYKEAKKSGDWWRPIGAVLVKNRKIIASSYNQGVPTDNYPYQVGSIRDFFKAGERQELSPTIHAEQKIISEAAKQGIKIKGSSLYVTHFPCSVCAKLIAYSGIKKVYFSEGASNLEGQKTLELSNVEIIYIPKK
jgi:dCMP deaminase